MTPAVRSAVKVEATTGFEPVNRGFADLGRTPVPDAHTQTQTSSDALGRPSPIRSGVGFAVRPADLGLLLVMVAFAGAWFGPWAALAVVGLALIVEEVVA